jgi:benzoate-CoA ligase family protein
MRIRIVGAGPAGLLFALLARRRRPDADLRVIEQNPRDATFGFGVVFSYGALEFLARDEPALHATLVQATEHWPMQRIVHRDQAVDIDGNGFAAIGRLRLLQLLQAECEAAGVAIEFGRSIGSRAELGDADLIVAADGLNSALRRELAPQFGPRIDWLRNKFAWYGTPRPFDCLTLTFRDSEFGPFVAHHYRYAPNASTFLVECDAATWQRAGLDRLDDAASRALCERIFAPDLQGAPLVSNRSIWRNFPLLRNERWSAGNVVLIGDALRTGHFSIGSGTRLGFDDAIALDRALGECGDAIVDGRPALLAAFERERRPVVDKLVAAANTSSFWYERLADKMALAPVELAYDYMTRSGRMPDERLAREAPRFMAQVAAARAADPGWAARREGRVDDPVPADSAGAREIGFVLPERYNAAAMLFDRIAEGRGDQVAAIAGERRVSYAELGRLACRAGSALAALGLARGGRVLMLLDDGIEYLAAVFGALRGGFVPVLANTLSPPELLAWMLQDTGAEAMLLDARFAAVLGHEGIAACRLRHAVVVGELAAVPRPELVTLHAWHDWVAGGDEAFPMADTHRDEMAFWMYSSGSTGRPKGVVHLHHDAPYTWAAYGRPVLGLREDDLIFSPPKIFFAYGFGNSVTFPAMAGARVLLLDGRPEPARIFDAIERHRPSVLFGLPTLYGALLAHPGAEQRDLSSLRLCVSAAEVLAAPLAAQWKRWYGLEIVEGLGSTEVLHIYLSNRPGRCRPGAAGQRVPGYELELVDGDGAAVPVGPQGASGILCVRGASQAPMYWQRPDKTAETMRDGWIWTGDRFSVDAEGFYTFEGRADDLVKVSGQWVHPLEVERCLATHPQVRECAVLAGEDAQRLKVLVAHVALAPGVAAGAATTAELQRWVKQRLLPYKYPRLVHYVDELPKTGTGKIDRQALRRAD